MPYGILSYTVCQHCTFPVLQSVITSSEDPAVDTELDRPKLLVIDMTDTDYIDIHRFNVLVFWFDKCEPNSLNNDHVAPQEAATFLARTGSVLSGLLRVWTPNVASMCFFIPSNSALPNLL